MSEEKNQPKPLKGFFSSISKLAVKHPKTKPGAYYKENQKQCLKHAVAQLSERLPHWGAGTIEQMVLVDMALERIAQRESRFSFMQESSTRTRKFAPFAPRDQGDIQAWNREFHKAGREYQRMVWVRSDLMRKRKIPTPEFWLFGRIYKGLKEFKFLREKCIERGGCCSRSCGCCRGTRRTKGAHTSGHCSFECHCCLYHRRGDVGALDVRPWVLSEPFKLSQESGQLNGGPDTSSNEKTSSPAIKRQSVQVVRPRRTIKERKPSPLRNVQSCY